MRSYLTFMYSGFVHKERSLETVNGNCKFYRLFVDIFIRSDFYSVQQHELYKPQKRSVFDHTHAWIKTTKKERYSLTMACSFLLKSEIIY